jgi:hypothetical protein
MYPRTTSREPAEDTRISSRLVHKIGKPGFALQNVESNGHTKITPQAQLSNRMAVHRRLIREFAARFMNLHILQFSSTWKSWENP